MAPQRLSLEQFAALRAYLGGMHSIEACRRFLTQERPPSTESAALRRLVGLLRTVAATAALRPTTSSEAALASRAVSILQGRINAMEQRRLQLRAHELRQYLAGARKVEPIELIVPQYVRPITSSVSASPYFHDLEEFRSHYIEVRLGGNDPDIGESEWESIFEDYLAELGDTTLSAAQPSSTDQGGVVPYNTPPVALSALTHAGVTEVQESQLLWAPKDAQDALSALETCRWVVDRHPMGSDRIDTWFKGNIVRQLQAVGLERLDSLTARINERGVRWWKSIPRLGPVRAQRVVEWLKQVSGPAGLQLKADSQTPVQVVRARQLATQARAPSWRKLAEVGLEPLNALLDSQPLDGAEGLFRLPSSNLLGAHNDLEAILAALALYKDRPATLAVYSREISRFALWCYFVKGKTIASITIPDARAYNDFLDSIPADWINPMPTPRGTPGWRPFRGQLGLASKRKALTCVHIILHQLHSAGYIAGNAMAGVLKRSALPRPVVNVARSFSKDQWNFILSALNAPAARQISDPRKAPRQRRLIALVRLIQSTGLRRDECFRARWSDLKEEIVDGQKTAVLKVAGSSGRSREVIIATSVLRDIQAHLNDRSPRFADDFQSDAGRARIPLISVLAEAVPAWHVEFSLQQPFLEQRPLADATGALSPDGIHRVLKRFFVDCEERATAAGFEPESFERASAHWMRHTFGNFMADSEADLRTVQEVMGHASIETTSHYAKKNRVQLLSELQATFPQNLG